MANNGVFVLKILQLKTYVEGEVLNPLFCFRLFSLPKDIIQRCHHCHRPAWPWPVACLSWSQLVMALLDMEEASASFSQGPPLQPLCCQNLATQTNTALPRLTSHVPLAKIRATLDVCAIHINQVPERILCLPWQYWCTPFIS